ncbi:MAG: MATE family efflux transporter [Gemmatimonadetes bacterium]|nr:MATE family efflux transporter [Gemmatimonadota bacterium]
MSRRGRLFAHELRGLLILAGPIVVNQLGQVGMNTVDTIMVGPLGAAPLAAAGLGSALHFFGLILATGIVMGMAPLVSQAFGRGDVAECGRVLVQGAWLALILSIPVLLSCLYGREITLALGQDPEVAMLTGGYLRALALGIPPALLFVAARQYLEGMGHAKAPMVVTFIGLGVNIVANRAFIYGVEDWIPAMGVVGSGWATTIVRWAMLVAVVIFLMMHRTLHIRAMSARPRARDIRHIFRVGGPIGAQFGMEVGLFSFAAVMMGWLGAVELAAHQVTINIASTTFMIALGTAMAGSIRVGQHIGGRRPRAMRDAVVATYLLSTGFMLCCAIVFVIAPRALIGLYTPHENIIDLGAQLLLIAAAFQLFDGAQVAGVSVLRGAAETRGPMYVAAIGYWGVGLPIAWLFAFRYDWGPLGVWTGLSIGLAVVALLLLERVRRVFWLRPIRSLDPGTSVAGSAPGVS